MNHCYEMRGTLLALALLGLQTGLSTGAFAGPDACTVIDTTKIKCSGDQSGGVSFVDSGYLDFVLQGLTVPMVPSVDAIFITDQGANGADGKPGVFGENGSELDLFVNGGFITTTGDLDDVILLKSNGGAGGYGQIQTGFPNNTLYTSGRGGDGGFVEIDVAGGGRYFEGIIEGVPIYSSASAGSITTTGNQVIGIGGFSKGGNAGDGVGPIEKGGNGGLVRISNATELRLEGDASIGIYALSEGGRGGSTTDIDIEGLIISRAGHADGAVIYNGGSIFMTGAGSTAILAESIGGDGGSSGDGGDSARLATVDSSVARTLIVKNVGQISVSGFDAGGVLGEGDNGSGDGIVAHGIGGDGGNGRDAGDLGGHGGAGGAGARINIKNYAEIVVSGLGISALSEGGNGGIGDSEGTLEGDGGNGGDGGEGKYISIITSGAIYSLSQPGGNTEPTAGIRAESLGGDGGLGGTSKDIINADGGKGGHAGDAGDIDVEVLADTTSQDPSGPAIEILSQGGNGGQGGDATKSFASDGGRGGAGGDGGDVSVLVDSRVQSFKDQAPAIRIQSAGGVGGLGGTVTTGTDTEGGDGGDGGTGGSVLVDLSSTDVIIRASGTGSSGVLAESLGGGGGGGGAAGGLVNDGGSGAGGAASGTVTVLNGGSITTSGGTDSHGISAQSIGGGGGTASSGQGFVSLGGDGGAGSPGAAVSVSNLARGFIKVYGDESRGIQAASIGGGGGDGGQAVGLTGIGGDGASSGNGGVVSVINAGIIQTRGHNGHGILGVSIGGGGGVGEVTGGGSGGSSFGLVTIGGAGGGGGNGGAVTIENQIGGKIATLDGDGINAESIGGGGGFANVVGGTIALGGTGGPGGNGGLVSVSNKSSIITGTESQSEDDTSGNHAVGIYAGSTGGGGGATRETVAVGIAGFSMAVGGSGGTGGDGDVVTVTTGSGSQGNVTLGDEIFWLDTARVETFGDYAHGVEAESVGGGGGSSGVTAAFSVGMNVSMSLAVGGSGGDGGTGGDVMADISGLVKTGGAGAIGVLAQSTSDGGGSAGSVFSSSAAFGTDFAFSTAIAIGGAGGNGGAAGNVAVNINDDALIQTLGEDAHGVYAASQGGGGGLGGTTFAGSIAMTKGISLTANVSVGGSGGTGGLGGDVTVDNEGWIQTFGDDARGVHVQSIGGGGGTAGSSSTASIQIQTSSKADGLAISVSVGGSGGSGNLGGKASVVNSGTISTAGDSASTIFTQSVGGGGGDGGGGDVGASPLPMQAILEEVLGTIQFGSLYKMNVSIGGSGGTGGDGGEVDIHNSGTLSSSGFQSPGIFAQNIGGGGGVGGDSGAGYSGLFTLGGSGGAAGAGGPIDIDNTGDIATVGALSHGIFAQSIGGGGGSAANADFGSLEGVGKRAAIKAAEGSYKAWKEAGEDALVTGYKGKLKAAGRGAAKSIIKGYLKPNPGLSIGGSGGAAGNGGYVDLFNSGSIDLVGDGVFGVFGQSIGGGGGNGGNGTLGLSGQIGFAGAGGSAGNGGAVKIRNEGLVNIDGIGGFGVFAQSVGAGGGIAGDLSLVVGTAGVEDERPSATTLTQGDIFDFDEFSIERQAAALFGYAALEAAGPQDLSGIYYNRKTKAEQIIESAIEALDNTYQYSGVNGVGISGSGSTLSMIVNDGSSIYYAFFDAEDVYSVLNQRLGTFAGRTGNGGAILVENTGTITIGTTQAETDFESTSFSSYGGAGIWAQSVGGGGGILGVNEDEEVDAFAFAGTKGGIGKASDIQVKNTGNVFVNTIDGYGVFAQSVGCTQRTQDAIEEAGATILQNPADFGLSNNACANSGGNITILVTDGEIQGGSGAAGVGIFVDEGKNNHILIENARVQALSGTAIVTTTGNDNIFLQQGGVLIGNVELGGGLNSVIAHQLSRFESGSYLDLGGGLFVNQGTLSPGGQGAVVTTQITGDFHQGPGGILELDVSFGEEASDILDVSGNVVLGGKLTPNLLQLEDVTVSIPVITTGGIFTDVWHGTMTVLDQSSLVNFTLTEAGTDLLLGVEVDETGLLAQNLSVSQQEAVAYIAEAASTDGSDLGFLFAYLANLATTEELQNAIDSIGGDFYSSTLGQSSTSAGSFGGGSFSCENTGITASWRGPEGQCYWTRVVSETSEYDPSLNNSGFDQDSTLFAMGVQRKLGRQIHAGLSLGFEDKSTQTGLWATTETDTTLVGATIKYFGDAVRISNVLTTGFGDVETSRTIVLPGDIRVARGKNDMIVVANKLRVERTMDREGFYWAPMIDVDVVRSRLDGGRETGAAELNLITSDASRTVLSATPALELGRDFTNVAGRRSTLVVRAGVEFSTDRTFTVETRFEGASTSIAPMKMTNDFETVLGVAEVGFETKLTSRISVKAGYEGKFHEDYNSHAASAKIRMAF